MPDTASISLEVAPSDKLQQLVDQITAMTGGGDEGGGGGGGRQNMAGRMSKMGKAGSKMVSAGLKKAGINFSLSSMLKQSQIFTGFLGSLFQILGGFLDVLLAPLIPILMPVLMFLGRMIPVIAKIAMIVLGPVVFIIGMLQKVSMWILDGILHIFDAWIATYQEKLDAIKEKFETAWNYIKDGQIWEAVKETLGALWDSLVLPVAAIWDTVVEVGEDIWDWLTGFELIKDMTTAFNTWYDNTISPFFDTVKNGWDSAMETVEGWYDTLEGAADDVWNWLSNFDLASDLATWWNDMWSGVSDLWDSAMETVGGWYDTLEGAADNIWDWLSNFDFVGGLADWWNDMWSNTIKPFVASIWNPVVDFLQDSLNWAADAMSNLKILGQQVTGLITAPQLSGMKIIPEAVLPSLSSLQGNQVGPPSGNTPPPPPRVNVEFWMHDIPPQAKVEVEVDGKRSTMLDVGTQMTIQAE